MFHQLYVHGAASSSVSSTLVSRMAIEIEQGDKWHKLVGDSVK